GTRIMSDQPETAATEGPSVRNHRCVCRDEWCMSDQHSDDRYGCCSVLYACPACTLLRRRAPDTRPALGWSLGHGVCFGFVALRALVINRRNDGRSGNHRRLSEHSLQRLPAPADHDDPRADCDCHEARSAEDPGALASGAKFRVAVCAGAADPTHAAHEGYGRAGKRPQHKCAGLCDRHGDHWVEPAADLSVVRWKVLKKASKLRSFEAS